MTDSVVSRTTRERFVGEGSFGCTFMSSLQCIDGTVMDGKLGKVFEREDDALQEQRNQILISLMDPDALFTVRMHKSCLVTAEKKNCRFLGRGKRSFHRQIMFDYGGVDYAAVHKLVASRAASAPRFVDLLKSMENVLFGLVTMQIYGFLHLDLTHHNILYDPTSNRSTMIDFGLFRPCSDVFVGGREYLSHRYMYFPPELKLAAVVTEPELKSMTFGEFRRFFRENFGSNKLSYAAFAKLSPAADSDLEALYNTVRFGPESGSPDKALKYLSQFAHKIDVYSVGMIVACMMNVYPPTAVPSRQLIVELIRDMTALDPRKRLDAAQAYGAFCKIVATPRLARHRTVVNFPHLSKLLQKSTAELRRMCAARDVSGVGTKFDLMHRLVQIAVSIR
jgi:serine/threonine protein kinase